MSQKNVFLCFSLQDNFAPKLEYAKTNHALAEI